MIPIRADFARGGTSCNEAMRTTGRAPHAVAGLTFWVKHVGTKNINTCAHLLGPCSGQLPFLGLSLYSHRSSITHAPQRGLRAMQV